MDEYERRMNNNVIPLGHIAKTVTDDIEAEVNRTFDHQELRLVIETIDHRLAILRRARERLMAEEERHQELRRAAVEELEQGSAFGPPSTKLADIRMEKISEALRITGYNRCKTAKVLGIPRSVLQRSIQKMKEAGYTIPENRAGRPV